MMEPRSRDFSTVLDWLNRSNCFSRGSCLIDRTFWLRIASCWQYSARTRNLIPARPRKEEEREGRGEQTGHINHTSTTQDTSTGHARSISSRV
ncbi:hypothetical protein GDO81_025799 [Engystomops pustulosus]|uniref:Uncharacterized protein n=1 Tax=Engystomops pustulosus TaxID=76066 RepID=A0AAV6YKW6_ENGPU|nr:hypothetical protein GDO81_025799 [Engystomops pustulosus]